MQWTKSGNGIAIWDCLLSSTVTNASSASTPFINKMIKYSKSSKSPNENAPQSLPTKRPSAVRIPQLPRRRLQYIGRSDQISGEDIRNRMGSLNYMETLPSSNNTEENNYASTSTSTTTSYTSAQGNLSNGSRLISSSGSNSTAHSFVEPAHRMCDREDPSNSSLQSEIGRVRRTNYDASFTGSQPKKFNIRILGASSSNGSRSNRRTRRKRHRSFVKITKKLAVKFRSIFCGRK